MNNSVHYRQIVTKQESQRGWKPSIIYGVIYISTICFWPIAWLGVCFGLASSLYPFLTNEAGIPDIRPWFLPVDVQLRQ